MHIYRASESDFEVTGRTLEGVALRLGRPSRVTDDAWASSYFEAWADRALTLSPTHGYPLDRQHDKNTVGEVRFSISEAERAVMFTAVVDDGPKGDKLLADYQSGQWSDVSIAANIRRSQVRHDVELGRVVWRLSAEPRALSLARTGTGLSKGAEVTILRAAPEGTPRLDALRKRLVLI